jgi:hypothetical protein
MNEITRSLESTLGPDTGDLKVTPTLLAVVLLSLSSTSRRLICSGSVVLSSFALD